MTVRTMILSCIIISSSTLVGNGPDHLIIPLNPKMTVTPTLSKATSLRLFGLLLATCGSALVYHSMSHSPAQGQQSSSNSVELTVGTVCTLISFFILHYTTDEVK